MPDAANSFSVSTCSAARPSVLWGAFRRLVYDMANPGGLGGCDHSAMLRHTAADVAARDQQQRVDPL